MPHGTQTLERGIALLKRVAVHHPAGIRLTELADLSDLERPTVDRLVQALAASVGHRQRMGRERQAQVAARMRALITRYAC